MSRSNTAICPPLDGSIFPLPGFVDFQAHHNPDKPWCNFPVSNPSDTNWQAVSFQDFADATHRVAHIIRPYPLDDSDHAIVAILLQTDTILYHAIVAGIMRAGMVPFPLATRISGPAIASLLERTHTHRIISQPAFNDLLDDVRAALPGDHTLRQDPPPALADIFPAFSKSVDDRLVGLEPYPALKNPPNWSDIVLYLHSSGSTGFPKPIPETHTNVLQWCLLDPLLEPRKRGMSYGGMMLPPFHTLGVSLQLLTPLASSQPVSLFPPRTHIPAPPVVPTPQNTLEVVRQLKFDVLLVVPSFLEAWVKNGDSVKVLAQLPAVTYCGGPLSSSAGDKLVAAGVRLYPVYGGTEFGGCSRILDTNYDNDTSRTYKKTPAEWEWTEFPETCNTRWIPQGDGKYELCFMSGPLHRPSITNLPNGEHGYATSDLFEPHPTKPGLWRIVGRADDVITLSTGEKIVPIQQQDIIGAHPSIMGVVMFGRGREQVGILVEPHPDHAIDPKDEQALVQFRNAIWPQVEEANRIAPAHGRIFKEMILVADPSRPLVRSAKNTVVVKQTIALYEKEIEALYANVKDTSEIHGISPPPSWTSSDVRQWLVESAAAINHHKIPDISADLFEQGFDSLSATYLRNHIIATLRSSPDDAAKNAAQGVEANFVFLHPTVTSLAAAVAALVNPDEAPSSTGRSAVEEIQSMISKYAAPLPPVPVALRRSSSGGAVVLLTGSTGSLGAHILNNLLQDKRVARVYALNRGQALVERQRAALEAAELTTEYLGEEKLTLLEGDIMRDDLSLELSVLDEIRTSVTHVVHNAWRVDFNLSLSSFEAYIAAAVRLLKMAPGAHFSFVSSISAAQSWRVAERGPYVPEQPLHDPTLAVGTGYGESKFVVEEVLARGRDIGYSTTTLRVGQICGSNQSGAWNTSEWVPSLVKSSIALGALPAMDGLVSWLPMEGVSRTVVDVMLSADAPPLVNVVHPHPAPSSEVFGAIRDALKLPVELPIVPMQTWLEKLEVAGQNASEDALTKTPAIKLLPFFRSVDALAQEVGKEHVDSVEIGGMPLYETSKAQSICTTLGGLRPLSKEDADKWVQYWRKQRFIE